MSTINDGMCYGRLLNIGTSFRSLTVAIFPISNDELWVRALCVENIQKPKSHCENNISDAYDAVVDETWRGGNESPPG